MALVHQWKFENDLIDSIGDSDGVNTSCTFSPNNNISGNYSVYMPKTPTGYVTLSNINIASYTNLSMAFWFRSVISNVEQYLVCDWTYPPNPDQRLSILIQNSNRLRILPYIGSVFYPVDSLTTLNLYNWNHAAITISGAGTSGYTLYINGKYNTSGNKPRTTLATSSFRLGVHSPGVTAAKFDGYMDDFRFYDTALTAVEVRDLYNSYFTEKAVSLMPLLI